MDGQLNKQESAEANSTSVFFFSRGRGILFLFGICCIHKFEKGSVRFMWQNCIATAPPQEKTFKNLYNSYNKLENIGLGWFRLL